LIISSSKLWISFDDPWEGSSCPKKKNVGVRKKLKNQENQKKKITEKTES
jgi:hypothetical protein